MAESKESFFKQLRALFDAGPGVRRKTRGYEYVKDLDRERIDRRFNGIQKAVHAKDSFNPYSNAMNNFSVINREARYADFEEMDTHPIISAALDTYADETVGTDEKGKCFHVFSENPKIKELLEELFFDIINVEYTLRNWTRQLSKFGDVYILLDISPEFGVENVLMLPVNDVERIENYDPVNPYAVKFRIISTNKEYEEFQVAHFRNPGNSSFLPMGTSVLDATRKIYRQVIMMEDAMITYRIIRSPERRVFYIDCGNIPPDSIESYMNLVKTGLKASTAVDRSNGKQDIRFNPQPVHKDTPIPLLDGRILTIEKLAQETEKGIVNHVYSINDKSHDFVPGKVVWCGKNYTATKLIRVTLDNDSTVITAPEHPFILRDGTAIRADELAEGMALMPFYTQTSSKENGDKIFDYEKVYSPGSQKYVYTHRVVGDTNLLEQKKELTKNMDWIKNNGIVTHHIDFTKHNNDPSNLVWMGNSDHIIHHQKIGQQNKSQTFYDFVRCDATREARRQTARKNQNYEKNLKTYNSSALHREHDEIRRQAQLKSWSDKDTAATRSKAMTIIVSSEMFDFVVDSFKKDPTNITMSTKEFRKKNGWLQSTVCKDPQFYKLFKKANPSSGRNPSTIGGDLFLSKSQEFGVSNYKELKELVFGGYYRNKFDPNTGEVKVINGGYNKPTYKNHKVKSVEVLNNVSEDVYCMTVVGPNGEDDRHNFAVCGLTEELSKELDKFNGVLDGTVDEQGKPNTKYHTAKTLTKYRNTHKCGILLKNSGLMDFFLAIRGPDDKTKIDTLPGGQNATAVDDVEYLQKQMFASLKIPKAFLNYSEEMASKATLAMMDVKFSRIVTSIQKVILAEMNKLALIHLFAHGFEGKDLINFTLKLSNPSTIAQQQKLELIKTKLDIANSQYDKEKGLISKKYLQKSVLEFSEDEIETIRAEQEEEAAFDKLLGAVVAPPPYSDLDDKIGNPFDGTTYDVPKSQYADSGVDSILSASDIELLKRNSKKSGPSNKTGFVKFDVKDTNNPVKPQSEIDKAYNYKRRVKTISADTDFSTIFKNITKKSLNPNVRFTDSEENNEELLLLEEAKYDKDTIQGVKLPRIDKSQKLMLKNLNKFLSEQRANTTKLLKEQQQSELQRVMNQPLNLIPIPFNRELSKDSTEVLNESTVEVDLSIDLSDEE